MKIIEIFTRDKCVQCDRLESLVSKHTKGTEIRTVKYNIDHFPTLAEMFRDKGYSKVPMVHIDGELIGGLEETEQLLTGK